MHCAQWPEQAGLVDQRMVFESCVPLEAPRGDSGGDSVPLSASGAASAWVLVRRGPCGAPALAAPACSPGEGRAGCGGRFWALSGDESDDEDGDSSPRFAPPPAGASLGDFVLATARREAGRGDRRRRFAPAGGGSWATAVRC